MADSAESLATTVYDQLDSKGYLTDLRKFESHPSFPSGVPYMYADSSGYITVGVGHNLSAHGLGGLTFVVKRKERYPFVLRKGRTYTTGAAGTTVDSSRLGMIATAEEIKNDFDFLTDHLGGQTNNYQVPNMQKYTTLELTATEIERLFKEDVIEHIKQSKAVFGDAFYKFPVSAQAAIVDIDFNVTGGVGTFKELVAAIKGTRTPKKDYSTLTESQRWGSAADESRRGPPIDDDRNNTIKQWFLDASTETAPIK